MLKILLLICLIFLGLLVYSLIYNFHSRRVIRQFINYINDYNPSVLLNVQLKHISFSRNNWYFHGEKIGDVYMMDDYWVLLCRGKFVFEIESFPLVIAKDSSYFRRNFPDFSSYKLTKVNMKHAVKSAFEIHYVDERYKHYKGEITFKALTPEQKLQLQKIGEWLQ